MCLAVPHTVIRLLRPGEALAEARGVQCSIRTDCLPFVQEGDTVLVHAGFAIEKVLPCQKEELAALWEEIYALSESGEPPKPSEPQPLPKHLESAGSPQPSEPPEPPETSKGDRL
jgi:hydrogenase expression/formation protein HypC